MKRSEMVKKIKDFLVTDNLWQRNRAYEDSAEVLLRLIEEEGMNPPRYWCEIQGDYERKWEDEK